MTGELSLGKLEGSNPLGFLAALGVLSCLDRAGRSPRLRWEAGLVPTAVVSGAPDMDDLVAVVDRDRQWWVAESLTLGWRMLSDVKVESSELRDWAASIRDAWVSDPANRWRQDDTELWSALVAEGAIAEKGDAKPTHLYFTAGQQRFLDMARRLAANIDSERIHEAIEGPWRLDSTLPSFSWDASGDRVYALRPADPSKETRLGVPGADWLAFLGLKFFPVVSLVARSGRRSLRTTGCDDEWKAGAFRWPLWSLPATPQAVAALVGDPNIVGLPAALTTKHVGPTRRRVVRQLGERGVSMILESPIRRSEQGGYGSFGAPTELIEASRVPGR